MKVHLVKIACLLLILLAGSAFVYSSFEPRMRFADPAPLEPLISRRNYPCFHDRIYLGSSQSDALVFGASKTHHALDTGLAMRVYEDVTGEPLDLIVFDPPQSNPDMSYFIFRDYLAHNVSPKVALFSLTWVGPKPPPVRYMHPLFAVLAPPYLYLDVLKSFDIVNNRLFSVSDFLRLLIRHVDLSLSRLLVADFRYVVPEGDNCPMAGPVAPADAATGSGHGSFAKLLAAEIEKDLPPIEPAQVGTVAGLLETYQGNRSMLSHIKKQDGVAARQGQRRETQVSLDYYRRIVALGKKYGVKVGFFYLPNILKPQPGSEDVAELEGELGAPIYVLPYWYTRVSYHHYRDPAHVTEDFRPVYSIWFASLVDRMQAD
jgi:hypothetical protein